MISLRSKEGELLIDHRASPGLSPSDVAQSEAATGLPVPLVSEGKTFETAVQTCAHCQAVVVMNPQRTRPRNYCSRCHHYICDAPLCNTVCYPYHQYLDELDARDRKGLPFDTHENLALRLGV